MPSNMTFWDDPQKHVVTMDDICQSTTVDFEVCAHGSGIMNLLAKSHRHRKAHRRMSHVA